MQYIIIIIFYVHNIFQKTARCGFGRESCLSVKLKTLHMYILLYYYITLCNYVLYRYIYYIINRTRFIKFLLPSLLDTLSASDPLDNTFCIIYYTKTIYPLYTYYNIHNIILMSIIIYRLVKKLVMFRFWSTLSTKRHLWLLFVWSTGVAEHARGVYTVHTLWAPTYMRALAPRPLDLLLYSVRYELFALGR